MGIMTNAVAARPRLSPEQVGQYRREGYFVYREPVLSPPKFDGLKNCFEKILADLPAETRPESMDVPHFAYPELFRWLFDDDVLDLVEPILGPDLALFSSHFICKPKGDGRRVPWHEDSHYWRNMLDPMEVCTVWLAIDPSRRENGCMSVIPRTHNSGQLGYSDYVPVAEPAVFGSEIVKTQRDDSKAVAIELEPNQASLHDGRLMHGSEANTSTLRRCGYTMRYISTRSLFDQAKHPYHRIFLARGRDHAGNTYGDPAMADAELVAHRSKHFKAGH